MSKPLIIVESYTKTKTISKYLDNKYTVICSLGHISDLPKTDLGIDTATWSGRYIPTKQKIIDDIRSNVKKATAIYLASDPDMEGEAIAHHIKNNIQDLLNGKQCHRIKFHEITKKAVTEALANTQDINQNVVEAQEARRFIDRLVGYKLSPTLWAKFGNNSLSVGRVQSAALGMCVTLLNKIEQSDIEAFWVILGKYNGLHFRLHHRDQLFKTSDKQVVQKTLDLFDFKSVPNINFKDSQSSESPSPPYTTTSLQQDAYAKHRFTSKKTMQLAQDLYENGHITYMRTDSTNISNDFKNVIIAYIKQAYPPEYAKFRSYKNKIANAQEAHEAVRVTHIDHQDVPNLSDDHNKLYKLIWKRTVASQMINAEYINTEVILTYPVVSDYSFRYKKSFLTNPGYLIVYCEQAVDASALTGFKEGFKDPGSTRPSEYIAEASVTATPSLYNEIGLIKALEKEGIGRPSTYASIIEKLLSKGYVQKGSNPQKDVSLCNIIKTKTKGLQEVENKINIGGKQKDLLVPTQLGISIIEYLEQTVPFLLDISFTSKMEDALDRICDQTQTKRGVLTDFYENHLVPVLPAQQSAQPATPAPQKTKQSGIIQTKYGYCYYHAKTNKYTNIESYLKWRQISADNLSDKDIKFLKSLPKRLDNGTYLHIGPYGLYIKDKNKNVKLDKSKWLQYLDQ
jgi:DNA topoisomerase-1